MLERFTLGEDEFNWLECDGVVLIIGIFRDETGELASFDELFQECASEFFDLLPACTLSCSTFSQRELRVMPTLAYPCGGLTRTGKRNRFETRSTSSTRSTITQLGAGTFDFFAYAFISCREGSKKSESAPVNASAQFFHGLHETDSRKRIIGCAIT